MIDTSKAFSGFAVNDVQAARRFYEEVLGMTVAEQYGMLQLTVANGAQVLVYPKPNHQPATFTVLNFVVDDVEATVDDLTGQGVKFEHYDMPEIKTDSKGISRDDSGQGPSAIAWFTDPAGNIVSLIQQ